MKKVVLIIFFLIFITSCSAEIKENEVSNEFDKNSSFAEFITFGKYPYYENGKKKDIEWIVLEKNDDSLFLLSKYAIDADIFDKKSNLWKESSLRNKLNNEFYNEAFNDEERKVIIRDSENGDNVSLLTKDECKKYLVYDEERICYPTPYAIKKGVFSYYGKCWWWLRNTGYNNETGSYVYTRGNIYYDGLCRIDVNGIRPTIRIKHK